MSSACCGLIRGVGELYAPAFMRPPVRAWDLITVGPPISSAIFHCLFGVWQKPCPVTGIPASSTIFLASYSCVEDHCGEIYSRTGRPVIPIESLNPGGATGRYVVCGPCWSSSLPARRPVSGRHDPCRLRSR